MMKSRDKWIAGLVVLIWGANFSVIEVALASFPPLLFAAMRFGLVAAIAAAVLEPPRGHWPSVIRFGIFMGVIKFSLLFMAMDGHADAGSSAVLLQAQVPFTMLLALLLLGERVSSRQWLGVLISAVGLLLLVLVSQARVDLIGVALILAAAVSFAAANLTMRRSKGILPWKLVAWSCLIPPLPLLGISALTEMTHPTTAWQMIASAPLSAWLSLAFVSLAATLLAFGLWGRLLATYPTATVMPFAMAVPVVALLTGSLWLGEPLAAGDIMATLLVIVGAMLCQLQSQQPRPKSPPEECKNESQVTAPECCARICRGGPAWEFYARSR